MHGVVSCFLLKITFGLFACREGVPGNPTFSSPWYVQGDRGGSACRPIGTQQLDCSRDIWGAGVVGIDGFTKLSRHCSY